MKERSERVRITFLGTGSAFTTDNWQSNLLIEKNEKKLLINCGGDVRHALKDKGLSYNDIDAVYVSHLHSDHIGGMEGLAFSTYFNPTLSKPQLFIHENLVGELWFDSLRGGFASLEDREANLSTYFDVVEVEQNGNFVWEGVAFNLVQTVHTMDNMSIKPSYGLDFVADDGTRIFVSSIISYYDVWTCEVSERVTVNVKDILGEDHDYFKDNHAG